MNKETQPRSTRITFPEAMTITPPLNFQERALIGVGLVGGLILGPLPESLNTLYKAIVEDQDVDPLKTAAKIGAWAIGMGIASGGAASGVVALRRGWLSRRDSGVVESYQEFRKFLKERDNT